jgi:hypothetical protein
MPSFPNTSKSTPRTNALSIRQLLELYDLQHQRALDTDVHSIFDRQSGGRRDLRYKRGPRNPPLYEVKLRFDESGLQSLSNETGTPHWNYESYHKIDNTETPRYLGT